MKNLITLLILAFTLQSCGDKTTREKSKEIKTSKVDSTKTDEFTEVGDEPEEDIYIYPKTGKKAEDFLPKIGIYEIQYEGKGDLNNDGLTDLAVVLRVRDNERQARPTLILLQNPDKSYRLDKVSNFAMPIQYAENGFQLYLSEEISIENGILKIKSFGTGGPSGNLFSTFKYFGNDLVLTYIETYNMGAGSHQSLDYDLEKGELTEEITNTMKEDMPSESKTFKLKKEKHKFENASPGNIIIEAYEKIDSEW